MIFEKMVLVQFGVYDSRVMYPKGSLSTPRETKYYEIELFTEDQPGICYINKEPHPLKKGTLICAKPGQLRYSKLPFKCMHMHLSLEDPMLCNALNALPDASLLSDISVLADLFHKLLALDLRSFPEQKLLLQGYVYRFLYLILEEFRGGSPVGEGTLTSHRRTMIEIENYIRKNPQQELDLQALAKRSNLSPVYFHKLFQAHTGMTPAAFVLSCRIASAKALLKAGDLPMSQIALQCGFSSQAYFNYKFKKVTGETPLHYRKTRLSRLKP